jgi:hypothetical protein
LSARGLAALLVTVLLTSLTAPVAAQWFDFKAPGVPRLPDGKVNMSAPAPRTADGKPDLSGVWQAGRASQYGLDYDVTQNLKPEDVQPWARALRFKRAQDFRKDSPLAHCMPVSVPFLNFRGLSQIVQTPKLIVVLHESPNSPHRNIYMDGRELPKDPNPTWLGYSVGKWDGDTLVITSIGFNELGWLDVDGNPQTESLKLTERLTRKDFGHLSYDLTFDDPKVFTKPFTLHMDKTFAADTDILEDVCENEKSGAHLTGGISVPKDLLAKYAGTYDLGGRPLVVSVQGDQLIVEDSTAPLDKLFVARTENTFSSSVSQVALEFVRDARGNVTHMVRRVGASEQRAVRK